MDRREDRLMKRMPLLIALLALLLLVAGCGDDEETAAPASQGAAMTEKSEDAMEKSDDDAMEKTENAMEKKPGTEIALGDSQFGDIIFDGKRQAIYVFELDSRGETVCYDECAEAWPPVYTKGAPVAGDGVDAELLGTVKRRDGRKQVTYDGLPLYYYAHEGPGEVKCHNVNLNGGLWWVVGADGKPLA
jgi:predicted lipoprotein with Yx(FWY)xxD motif